MFPGFDLLLELDVSNVFANLVYDLGFSCVLVLLDKDEYVFVSFFMQVDDEHVVKCVLGIRGSVLKTS